MECAQGITTWSKLPIEHRSLPFSRAHSDTLRHTLRARGHRCRVWQHAAPACKLNYASGSSARNFKDGFAASVDLNLLEVCVLCSPEMVCFVRVRNCSANRGAGQVNHCNRCISVGGRRPGLPAATDGEGTGEGAVGVAGSWLGRCNDERRLGRARRIALSATCAHRRQGGTVDKNITWGARLAMTQNSTNILQLILDCSRNVLILVA